MSRKCLNLNSCLSNVSILVCEIFMTWALSAVQALGTDKVQPTRAQQTERETGPASYQVFRALTNYHFKRYHIIYMAKFVIQKTQKMWFGAAPTCGFFHVLHYIMWVEKCIPSHRIFEIYLESCAKMPFLHAHFQFQQKKT